MKTKVSNLEITAEYIGGKKAPWKNGNSNYHIITIKNTETGKEERFDFWQSSISVTMTTEQDVRAALNCILTDALYGNGSLKLAGFCDELGYCIEDVEDAIRSFRACKKTYAQMKKLGYGTGKIIDTLNELNGN